MTKKSLGWLAEDAKDATFSGYLPLRVIGMLLIAIAFAIISFDVWATFGERLKAVSPVIFYVVLVIIITVGLMMNVYASRRLNRINDQLGPGAYSGKDFRRKGRG